MMSDGTPDMVTSTSSTSISVSEAVSRSAAQASPASGLYLAPL